METIRNTEVSGQKVDQQERKMKCVLLAGGYGTRLAEETSTVPKPMIEIGDKPIMWHIMKIYSTYGINEFFVTLGYKSEVIKKYFHDVFRLSGNMTIDLSKNEINARRRFEENWLIHLEETGLHSMTGGRLGRLKPYLNKETFCLTYGDGVANVDISKVIDFHKKHGKIATVTAVRPPARFGGIKLAPQGQVETFLEKPQIGEGWINGGFFVFEPEIFDYIEGDQTILESHVLENLAKEGQLFAYEHNDFWQCMDTLRDKRLLESLWQEGKAPWKIWK